MSLCRQTGCRGYGHGEGWRIKSTSYEVKSSQQVDAFSGGDFYRLQDMALSPDGKKMLLAYWDALVLWDIPRRRSLNVYKDFLSTWHLAAMSANGKTFVSVSHYYIKAWNIASKNSNYSSLQKAGPLRGSPSLVTARKSLSFEHLG